MALFKPLWEDKDPQKRINWIKQAKPDDPRHNRLLKELAKNDLDRNVRIEATNKITDQVTLVYLAKENSDFESRSIAVSKLTDESILTDIAKGDKDYPVRQVAYKILVKEESPEALADIALNDSSESKATTALDKLNDQSIVAMIVQSNAKLAVRKHAASKLTDRELIVGVALKVNDDIRRELVNHINDNVTLGEIAIHCSKTCYDIIKKIDEWDKSVLTQIANTAVSYSNRILAFERLGQIDCQQAIEDMAINESNFDKRICAIEKLTSQKLLADIALNDSNKYIRRSAVSKMVDKDIIVDIAQNDKDYEVRCEAIKKIDDQNLLERIISEYKNYSNCESDNPNPRIDITIKNHKAEKEDEEVIIAAIKRITNQTLLKEIVKKEKSLNICTHAIERIDDQDFLFDTANNNINHQIRRLAISYLADQSKLIEISRSSDIPDELKIAAIKKLEDRSIIIDIAKFSPVYSIRKSIYEVLYKKFNVHIDLKGALDVIYNDPDDNLRLSFLKKISDRELLKEISRNAKEYSVRLAVYRVLNEKFNVKPDLLEYVDMVKNERDANLALEILNKLITSKKLNDQNILLDIALNSVSNIVRTTAVTKICDQKMIADIARSDEDVSIRKEAIVRINDVNLLNELAINDQNYHIRHCAIRSGKIANKEMVEKLLHEMIYEENESAAETLQFLYHNALLTEEVKKAILQNKDICYIQNTHTDQHCDLIGTHHDTGHHARYFHL